MGSQADPGYAEQMRAVYGREDVDPPRHDPQTSGSSSQGTSTQSSQRTAWQSRPGQSVPAFPGSRIILLAGSILERLPTDEAYEDDFGEHGGSPVDSIYPSVAAP